MPECVCTGSIKMCIKLRIIMYPEAPTLILSHGNNEISVSFGFYYISQHS